MNRDLVTKALIDWNFWYKEQYTGISRDEYVRKLLQIMKSGLVADVIGVKRSGKSTIFNQIISQLIKEGVNPFDTLLVNFEDSRFSEIEDGKNLFELYDIYKEIRAEGKKSTSKPFIFLDEVQKVSDWEGFVRSLVDRKEAYVAVSGSTSELTKGKLMDVLGGRHISIEVYPLSFKEFISFKGIALSSRLDLLAKEDLIKSLFIEYLKFGGFPLVVLSNIKEKILVNLYEDIISKDVIQICRIKNEDQVRTLSLYYVSNIANRVTLRRISESFKIPLRNIQRYTQCLLNSFLIFLVEPLSPKLSVMKKAEKKVYLIDQGLSNVIGYKLNQTLGSLLENAVYIELLRRYGKDKIFYYRGKGEIDFVIRDNNQVKEAYQVTYSLTDPDREIKGIKEILSRKSDVKITILTFDDEKKIDVLGKPVQIVKAWKWMLGI